jgi:hypothetical protein
LVLEAGRVMAYMYQAAKTAEDCAITKGVVFPVVGEGMLVGEAALTWFFWAGVGAGVAAARVARVRVRGVVRCIFVVCCGVVGGA